MLGKNTYFTPHKKSGLLMPGPIFFAFSDTFLFTLRAPPAVVVLPSRTTATGSALIFICDNKNPLLSKTGFRENTSGPPHA
ncbi:MAG TPA: hypothetical protein DCZ10_16580 [Pelotomaculum sp.]|nr:hypothetical protein [Pelotomaculum sp.]